MTTPLSAQRVEELRGVVQSKILHSFPMLSPKDYDDLLAILDDYSSMRAENEELVGECENWEDSFKRVNAQLAKQAPLVEDLLDYTREHLSDHLTALGETTPKNKGRADDMRRVIKDAEAALKLREGEK
jgi:hypothetical protein